MSTNEPPKDPLNEAAIEAPNKAPNELTSGAPNEPLNEPTIDPFFLYKGKNMQFASVEDLFYLLKKENPELKSINEFYSTFKEVNPELESIEDIFSIIKNDNPEIDEPVTIEDVLSFLKQEALDRELIKGLSSASIKEVGSTLLSMFGDLGASTTPKAQDDEADNLERLSGVDEVQKKDDGKA